MRTETLINLFRREINIENLTDCFWYKLDDDEGIHFSETDEVNPNPENWRNGGYVSDRIERIKKRKGYMIATIENSCGETYQAVFKESKEVKGNG